MAEASGAMTGNDGAVRGISRRRLFTLISLAGGGAVTAAIAVPLIGYVLGPLLRSTPDEWLDLGPTSDFTVGQTRAAQFTDPSSVPWAGQTANTAVWVRRSGQADFTVFAVNCTHLGCPVNWLAEAQIFLCPCHGGVYNADGTVAGGPPPRGLFTYKARVQDGHLQALSRPLPTAS